MAEGAAIGQNLAMKRLSLLGTVPTFALFACLSIPLLSATSLRDGPTDDTPVGVHMEAIGKAQKGIRAQLKVLAEAKSDAAFDAALALAQDAQKHALQAKNEDPVKLAEIPEGERRAFVADYRRAMKNFIAGWIDLEIALYERDLAAAEAAFKAVGKMKSGGHKSFKKKRARR